VFICGWKKTGLIYIFATSRKKRGGRRGSSWWRGAQRRREEGASSGMSASSWKKGGLKKEGETHTLKRRFPSPVSERKGSSCFASANEREKKGEDKLKAD